MSGWVGDRKTFFIAEFMRLSGDWTAQHWQSTFAIYLIFLFVWYNFCGRSHFVDSKVSATSDLVLVEIGIRSVEPVPEVEPAVARVESEVVEVVELGGEHDGEVVAGVVHLSLDANPDIPRQKSD